MATSLKSHFTVRIFPEDETTLVLYENVTHVFWEANATVLVLCLPDGKHAHWLREWIRHYDVSEAVQPVSVSEAELEHALEQVFSEHKQFHWSFQSARDLPGDRLSQLLVAVKKIAQTYRGSI